MWLSLKPPPSLTALIRLQSLLGLPVSAPRKRTRGPPLDSLPVLLWFFKLQGFALEIIDAGLRTIQPSLKIFHFVAELLMLRIQFLQVLTIGLIHLVLQRLLEQS